MNWVALTSLSQIYHEGRTSKKRSLMTDSLIKYLLNSTQELRDEGDEIAVGTGFREYYEREHLANYIRYRDFLEKHKFIKPQTRFEEADIKILMDIEQRMQTGELLAIRNQIIEAEESQRGVSLMFFKNEKYLKDHDSLIDPVKQLLGIERLADERDQQYKYVLECSNPKCIVLCENIDFLKRPIRPREHNIELWYAGGRNVPKLEFADTRGLPIYYSCDWDHDGLDIFRLVKEIIPTIQLLFPTGEPKGIKATDHKSLWQFKDKPYQLSGIDSELLTNIEATLVQNLIKNDSWIIEESNDLIKMVTLLC